VACDTLRGGPARGRTPRDAEFSVIKTHLYCDFERTHDTRTPYAVDVTGGGRSSANKRREVWSHFIGYFALGLARLEVHSANPKHPTPQPATSALRRH
jgi:hypothetical protein